MDDWKQRFTAWQDYAAKIKARADAVTKSKHDRAWALAATVGIPRCACSLHNASIDEAMTGWCSGPNGRKRLKVAKAAVHMLNDWRASKIADQLIYKHYPR